LVLLDSIDAPSRYQLACSQVHGFVTHVKGVDLVLLLFGPPGCGKGTQAAFLAQRFGIPAISTGEILRAEAHAGTPLGKVVADLLAKGELIGDSLVNDIVASRIARPDCARGFLLDGYPRTVAQAMYFSALLHRNGLPDPLVIHIDVPDDALVERLSARRQCPACHRIYNLLSQPPLAEGVCDADGATLITREDDSEPVIRRRLRAYRELTDPVLQWFGTSAVRRVDGAGPPDVVARAIKTVVLKAARPPVVPAA